jgi:regulator of replication initiation timing
MSKRYRPSPYEALEAENRKLRMEVQELKERVRAERRRANQHADEVACIRQQQVEQVRRNSWTNGVMG